MTARFGGVAEARYARNNTRSSVLMLMPGSGLGCAFIDRNGLPLDGDTLAGMEGAHMPAPLQLLGVNRSPAAAVANWGCFETYTTIFRPPLSAGGKLKKYPNHELATPPAHPRKKFCPSAAVRKKAMPSRSKFLTSRLALWDCISRTSPWRSTPASSSSAAA